MSLWDRRQKRFTRTCRLAEFFPVFVLFFLAAPSFAFSASALWEITTGASLAKTYSVTTKQKQSFSTDRLYYDIKERRFMADFATPEIGKTQASHHALYVITPETGNEQWIRTSRSEDVFGKYIFPLLPFGEGITIDTNSTATKKNLPQPFGNHKTTAVLQKEGSKNIMQLAVYNPEGQIIFKLQESSKNKSSHYETYWSVDGRFLFIILPSNIKKFGGFTSSGSYQFMVLGPFDVKYDSNHIAGNLIRKRQNIQGTSPSVYSRKTEEEKKYGPLYVQARTKIMSCAPLKKQTGRIYSLSIENSRHSTNFGNPVIVGKDFLFSYKAEKNKGRIKAAAIKPEKVEEWGDKYKNHLETVTIETDSGTHHVVCP